MTLTAETGPIAFPEIPASAKAAAKAINDAGGVNGHPITIITCDDKLTPAGAAACARKAISEKVTAVVGAISPTGGDSYMPILEKAGIPSVADLAPSNSEATSPLSYPIASSALGLVAGGSVLKAAGATKIQYLGPNLPAFVGLMKLVSSILPTTGAAFNGDTLFPVAATDYSQYVTSAYGSGADGVVPILTTSGTLPAFVNAVAGAGFSFTKNPTVLSGTLLNPDDLTGQLKDKLNGVYVYNIGQTPTDESLPGIKTYHDELAAAAGEQVPYKDSGLEAWVGVHVIAQILAKTSGDITSPAVLIAAMKAAGPISYPGWSTFDWSKPALPAPLSAALPRYFTTQVWVSKIVDNQEVAAVSDFAPFSGPITLTK
jgi:ABC-type branched-subunit amino acid transport system substrate-binding protein